MKTIAIIGASAGVGLKAVEYALAQGHAVRTLSRRPLPIPSHSNLTVVQGSATNPTDVEKTIDGTEAIVVALGTGLAISWKDFTKGTPLYHDATAALLQVLTKKQSSVPLIALTGFGAGESMQYQPFFIRLFMSALLGRLYANKTEMEEMIVGGYSNWEIIRPGVLTDKPPVDSVPYQTELKKGMKVGSISRTNVARFLVDQAANPTLLRRYVTLPA